MGLQNKVDGAVLGPALTVGMLAIGPDDSQALFSPATGTGTMKLDSNTAVKPALDPLWDLQRQLEFWSGLTHMCTCPQSLWMLHSELLPGARVLILWMFHRNEFIDRKPSAEVNPPVCTAVRRDFSSLCSSWCCGFSTSLGWIFSLDLGL